MFFKVEYLWMDLICNAIIDFDWRPFMSDHRCSNCGKQLPADSVFCQFCGSKIDKNDFPNDTQANVDLIDALQQREATILAVEKKKKRNKKIVIAIISVIFIFLIALTIKNVSYNAQPRNMATETMDANYTNVYADVVSVKPKYIIYKYNTTKSGYKIGDGEIWEIVCQCKTVEGKYIWASFFYQKYPGGNYSKDEKDYKELSYSRSNPLHLTGNINTARQVSKELDETFNDILFLNVQNAVQVK